MQRAFCTQSLENTVKTLYDRPENALGQCRGKAAHQMLQWVVSQGTSISQGHSALPEHSRLPCRLWENLLLFKLSSETRQEG